MIVCQCSGMNEASIVKVLRQLPNPADVTVEEVIRACGAGGDCTQCVPQIQAIIESQTLDVKPPNFGR